MAGFTLRQFTGVLAHEFGHFSQGAGMRLSVLIRSINLWFARVVYERDEWDQTLLGWSSPSNGAGMIFGLAIRGAVWLTRRVLWVLMHVGHLVSGFLSRQMEFDADRYQARMVGGKALATTLEQVNFLSFAYQAAHADLSNHWRERRLPDDLAKLVLVKHSEFGDELRNRRSRLGRFGPDRPVRYPPERLRPGRQRSGRRDSRDLQARRPGDRTVPRLRLAVPGHDVRLLPRPARA